MPQALDNIITGAVADPTTLSVRVTWANGGTSVNRFDHRLGTGVFAAAAGPAVFAQVRVGEGGRSLEWPGEIDFCADALWFEAHPADAPRPADLPASATYERKRDMLNRAMELDPSAPDDTDAPGRG